MKAKLFLIAVLSVFISHSQDLKMCDNYGYQTAEKATFSYIDLQLYLNNPKLPQVCDLIQDSL
jgi:hypothetical protein